MLYGGDSEAVISKTSAAGWISRDEVMTIEITPAVNNHHHHHQQRNSDDAPSNKPITSGSSGFASRMLSIFGNSSSSSRSGGSNKSKNNSKLSPKAFTVRPRSTLLHQSRRLSPSNDDDPECFHRAAGPILLLAQFFGLLPIHNVRSISVKKLAFKRFSPRAVFAYMVLLAVTVMSTISFVHLLRTLNASSFQKQGGISDATAGAVFYGNSLFGNLMFLRLCPRWISLQYEWRAMERLVDKCTSTIGVIRPKLRWRFNLIAVCVLGFALFEHVLSVVNNTPVEYFSGNRTLEDFLTVYTQKSHRFIVSNIDYNFTLGLFIFVISKIATFTWNFTDVFIMMVSTGIAERYKCLNARVTRASPNQLTVSDWHELRESYAVMSGLVKRIDRDISGIILLSFGNNIYFICLQLLNGLTPDNGSDKPLINSIYFFGSFIFLISRTISVTLLCARINDQCKDILPTLYNCPSINYCIEAQRLQQQIATDDVALTGYRFFYITRNFMLAVAGAIVTYEVVLLQFNMALKRE